MARTFRLKSTATTCLFNLQSICVKRKLWKTGCFFSSVDFLLEFEKSRVDAQVAMQNLFSQRLTPCCLRLFGWWTLQSHLVTTIRDLEETACEHCSTHRILVWYIYLTIYNHSCRLIYHNHGSYGLMGMFKNYSTYSTNLTNREADCQFFSCVFRLFCCELSINPLTYPSFESFPGDFSEVPNVWRNFKVDPYDRY